MAEPPSTPARKPSGSEVRPGLLRRGDAARFCGVGVSTWDRLVAAGLTPSPVKLGGSVAWGRAELAEWCRRGCPPRAEWVPLWTAIVSGRPRGRS